jgi:hypothetical protein
VDYVSQDLHLILALDVEPIIFPALHESVQKRATDSAERVFGKRAGKCEGNSAVVALLFRVRINPAHTLKIGRGEFEAGLGTKGTCVIIWRSHRISCTEIWWLGDRQRVNAGDSRLLLNCSFSPQRDFLKLFPLRAELIQKSGFRIHPTNCAKQPLCPRPNSPKCGSPSPYPQSLSMDARALLLLSFGNHTPFPLVVK